MDLSVRRRARSWLASCATRNRVCASAACSQGTAADNVGIYDIVSSRCALTRSLRSPTTRACIASHRHAVRRLTQDQLHPRPRQLRARDRSGASPYRRCNVDERYLDLSQKLPARSVRTRERCQSVLTSAVGAAVRLQRPTSTGIEEAPC